MESPRPRRVRPPALSVEALPPISIVLVSHNHYDHGDLPTLRMLARRFDPIVITPLGNARLVRSAGLRRVEELDWWQRAGTTALPITLTPAHHFSARGALDRNRALWGGLSSQQVRSASTLLVIRRTRHSSLTFGTVWDRSILPYCRLAPMSRAGS